jgi:hypothetical protein
VVEILLEVSLAWSPAPSAATALADGGQGLGTVEPARTTRDGIYPAGTAIRLALRLAPGDSGRDVVAIELTLDATPVTIVLER